jgi:O-antigen/teichoic acid export membrane protein
MVQRGLNWAATTLVGVFGFVWIGVVVFAAVDAPTWARVGQASFGTCLALWALYKASRLLRRPGPRFVPRHRRARA